MWGGGRVKILTKNTDYAIRALIVLALDKNRFISAREISQEQNIPYQFLRGVLRKLKKNKLIESKEGMGGGVRIIKNSKQINIFNLIKIFQGDFEVSECMFKKNICPNRKSCVLRSELKRIEYDIGVKFRNITLAKLLANIDKKS